jgi:hypothetical protein
VGRSDGWLHGDNHHDVDHEHDEKIAERHDRSDARKHAHEQHDEFRAALTSSARVLQPEVE